VLGAYATKFRKFHDVISYKQEKAFKLTNKIFDLDREFLA